MISNPINDNFRVTDANQLEYLLMGSMINLSGSEYTEIQPRACQKAYLGCVNLPQCTIIGSSAFQSASIGDLNLPMCAEIPICAFQSASIVGSIDLTAVSVVRSSAFKLTGFSRQTVSLPNCRRIESDAFHLNNSRVTIYAPSAIARACAFAGRIHAVTIYDYDDNAFMHSSYYFQNSSYSIAYYSASCIIDEVNILKSGLLTPWYWPDRLHTDRRPCSISTCICPYVTSVDSWGLRGASINRLVLPQAISFSEGCFSSAIINELDVPYFSQLSSVGSYVFAYLKTSQSLVFDECSWVYTKGFDCLNAPALNLPKCKHFEGGRLLVADLSLPLCEFFVGSYYNPSGFALPNCVEYDGLGWWGLSIPQCKRLSMHNKPNMGSVWYPFDELSVSFSFTNTNVESLGVIDISCLTALSVRNVKTIQCFSSVARGFQLTLGGSQVVVREGLSAALQEYYTHSSQYQGDYDYLGAIEKSYGIFNSIVSSIWRGFTIWVPKSLVTAYKSAPMWRLYSSIIAGYGL